MRSKAQPKPDAARSSRHKDMFYVVHDILVHMQSPGPKTLFRLNEEEIFENLMSQIRRECPTLAGKVEGL